MNTLNLLQKFGLMMEFHQNYLHIKQPRIMVNGTSNTDLQH